MDRRWTVKQFIALYLLAGLTGCSAVDTSPIGGGLAVIGLALIVAAVINTLTGKGDGK
jgi:hypothetical protein